jgi:hypothetical protein
MPNLNQRQLRKTLPQRRRVFNNPPQLSHCPPTMTLMILVRTRVISVLLLLVELDKTRRQTTQRRIRRFTLRFPLSGTPISKQKSLYPLWLLLVGEGRSKLRPLMHNRKQKASIKPILIPVLTGSIPLIPKPLLRGW